MDKPKVVKMPFIDHIDIVKSNAASKEMMTHLIKRFGNLNPFELLFVTESLRAMAFQGLGMVGNFNEKKLLKVKEQFDDVGSLILKETIKKVKSDKDMQKLIKNVTKETVDKPVKNDKNPRIQILQAVSDNILRNFDEQKIDPMEGYELLTRLQCSAEQILIDSKGLDPEIVERLRMEIRSKMKMTEAADQDEDDGEFVGEPVNLDGPSNMYR